MTYSTEAICIYTGKWTSCMIQGHSVISATGIYIWHSTEIIRHAKPYTDTSPTKLYIFIYIYIYIYIFHMFSFIQNNYKRRRNVFVNFVWSTACRWISTDYAQKYKRYNTYTHSYIIHQDSRMFQSSPDQLKGCIISSKSKKQMIYKIHTNYGYSNRRCFKVLSRYELVNI